MFNFNSLLIFSEDPLKLADFYQKVLGQEPGWSEGDYRGFMVGSGMLMVGPHDKVHGKNQNPERMMFNLETKEVEKEFERLKNLTKGLKLDHVKTLTSVRDGKPDFKKES